MEPSQMDNVAVSQVTSDGTLPNRQALKKKKYTKKANLFNQTTDSDSKATHKFNLSICQHKKRKSVHPPSQMDIVASKGILFQEDLMTEILSWLPVRSLFRFKCVSKSWDITSDPYFKMKHQNHPLRFLLLHSHDHAGFRYYSNLYSTSSLSSAEDVQKLNNYFPSYKSSSFIMLFGSCNGLVLVGFTGGVKDQLLLVNPSTRESILLPLLGFAMLDSTFGIGYDTTTDDYKILTIQFRKRNTTLKPYFGILALKIGSWREVGFMGHPFMNGCGAMDPLVFVHGAFHWAVYPSLPYLLSFHISNERYRRIPLLEQMYHQIPLSTVYCGLSVLDGMLCSFTSSMNHGEVTFTLWAMKDYGVKESWAQLFKIKLAGQFIAKPIYRFADGDVLLQCFIGLTSFFRTSKGPFRFWTHSLTESYNNVDIITFKESLISPKSLI